MLEDLTAQVAGWFGQRFDEPTSAQLQTVPHILGGDSVLLSSPTGSGKTLAGFLGVIDHLVRLREAGELRSRTYAVYISPLRALTYDVEKNLREPLQEMGLEEEIRIGLRTGDTSANERAKMRRKPPHILLTTPESLAIILPQKGFAESLSQCRFVLIDELHALAANKRGSHLMVSLERMERMAGREQALCRIGLSATVAPLDRVAEFLVGPGRSCAIAVGTKETKSVVEVLTPIRKDPYPPAGFTAGRVLRDIANIVEGCRTTLIFCNTRSGAESIAHRLKMALPEMAELIEAHHSSLDRDLRLSVEDRLKEGALRAVVCSTSLELGIDIGSIDTVVMISTPKGVSRALQRIGRSGHSIHQTAHGVLVATNINDLIECAACAAMVKRGQLDPVVPLEDAFDVAAQHIVGMAMGGGTTRDEAFETLRASFPFRDYERAEFDRAVRYLLGGGESLEGQYRETFGKIVEDADGNLVTPGKKVERDYLVNIGTIHSRGMVRVYLGRRRLGEIEEAFLKRIKPGDIFVLAGRVVRLVESGVSEAKVKAADGRMPTIPKWNANKMPLASGLANEVSALRGELEQRIEDEGAEVATDWLAESYHLSATNSSAIIAHCEHQLRISQIPTAEKFLIERFVPEEEKERDLVHFFFHSLIGRSANDALSRIVARRLSDAVGGNAMVTIDDYGFLLTLRSFQQLELEDWRTLFDPENAEADLDAALHGSELVKWQFRGVAQTALMVPRNLPGKQRSLKQVRWSSEILFQVLSEHEPNHPVLAQAYAEAKHTFLDTDAAVAYMSQLQDLDWCFCEVPAVSPFAFGIFATKIKEGMMMEDPAAAIERLYAEFERRV